MSFFVGVGAVEACPSKVAMMAPDPRFSYSNPRQSPTLVASVARSGVINPVWLVPSKEIYNLVCGFRRYQAAIDAGLEKIPAIILHDADEYTLLLLGVEENAHTRGLNLAEKANLIRLAIASFGKTPEQVIDTLFPAMGLERSMVVFNAVSQVAEYGPEVQALVATSGMGVKQATVLAQFQMEERQLAAEWLLAHKYGQNRCVQALEALLDIRVNQGEAVADVVDEMEKAAPRDWDTQRRAEVIFSALMKKSKPALARMERDFSDAVAALAMPSQAKIRPPINFEGRHVELTIRADGAESLASAVTALARVEQERLSKLFQWI